MNQGILSGKRILILIAPENFQDQEYAVPRKILAQAGATVHVASSRKECIGKYGAKVTADILLDHAERECADYDCVIVVGGGGVRQYFENPSAKNICRFTLEAGRVLSAICAGPGLLAHAGVLNGRNATSHTSEVETLQRFGAYCTGKDVEVEGNIITANGPEAATQFGTRILERLR